ncbi:MAG TPA: ABC transporter ATP-binding protein [Opitutaceae bacterium]|jgi:ATP-binding cassette subfamily B protein|nr:ABC transporter ATP-binding protein [Opitutaceae bacterium]
MKAPGLHGNVLRGITEERPPGASIDWKVVLRVLTYSRPYAVKRNAVFILTALRAVQKPALAWALAAIIKGPISRGDFRGTLLGSLGFVAIALFTEIVFHYRQRLSLELGEAVVHDLRNDIFQNLQRMPLSYFHKTKLGRILSRVITDIESVRRGMQQVFFFSLLLIGQMAGSAALMLYYNWQLFCVLLGIGPLVWLTNRYFHPRLSRLSRVAAESSSRLTGNLAESVRGIRVIQGFTRQQRGEEIFGGFVDKLAGDNVALASESALYVPLLDLNSQLFIAAMLVVGGYGALHGFAGMEIGSLIAFFFLPALFFQSLQQLGNLYTQTITSMAGAERVFQLIDLRPEWSDAPDAGDLPDPRTDGRVAGARVEFHAVSFGYDPARLVLHEVSFAAEPGQTVALVGHTGSGKTSIINLVAKFYLPTRGELFVDGREIRALRSESLRRQMGIVLQTNFLFTGSVMENIRLGRPEASDDEVVEAARRLDCLDLLENLPQGIITQVGEGGTNLSLGQRQLVCFARALLANPRILILDEATSAVDPVTEHRLQRALGHLLAGRTSFVVAHRLSTILRADQIIVLDHGRIVERGTHHELLAQRGTYWSLYRQFVFASEPVAGLVSSS